MSQASQHPAAAILDAIPYNKTLGLVIEAIGDGHARVRLPVDPRLFNHIGTPHAGALFGLAEAASGGAVLGAFAAELARVTPLAREATIRYRKVAKGEITAVATLTDDKAAVLAALPAADKGVNLDVRVVLTDGSGEETTEMTVRWFLKKQG